MRKALCILFTLTAAFFVCEAKDDPKDSTLVQQIQDSSRVISSGTYIAKQDYGRSKYCYGIDPVRDSLAQERFRHRSDSIRKKRPVVAVVLSGGGAKGAAHIGVLRKIEEMNIPVDMVLGTSMGGLMGGLFALGYDSYDIEKIITDADWDKLIMDKIPRNYYSYATVQYNETYILRMPFGMDKETKKLREEDNLKYDKTLLSKIEEAKKAKGAKGEETLQSKAMSNLPSGYVKAQNVNNLINSLAVGYNDPMDFLDLPIPYVCVAADVVSLKPKVWYSGCVTTAMRSTMSIPGLFAPVREEGMMLVDGGVRNNYPVDIARELGADIVIGVTLATPSKTYSEVNNVIDMFSNMIDMLGTEKYTANYNSADLTVRPDISGYSMLSFSKENIETLIARGYEEASLYDSSFVALKERVPDAYLEHHRRRARNLTSENILVNDVFMTGVNDKEEKILKKDVTVASGMEISGDAVDEELSKMYATHLFDELELKVHGKNAPYDIELKGKKGAIHQVGLGLRLDTEEAVIAMVNLSLNRHRLYGHKFDVDARLSLNPYVSFKYTYKPRNFASINVDAFLDWANANGFLYKDSNLDLKYFANEEKIYLETTEAKTYNFKGGIKNTNYWINNFKIPTTIEDARSYYTYFDRNNLTGLFVTNKWFTFDNGYFPTGGLKAGVDVDWYFAEKSYSLATPEEERSFWNPNLFIVAANWTQAFSFGKHITIIPSVYTRMVVSFNENEIKPSILSNMVGGYLPGRYIQQQVPFVGTCLVSQMGSILAMGRLDIRGKIAKKHYVTAMGSYARDAANFKDFIEPAQYTSWDGVSYVESGGRDSWGVALEYAYSSFVGPMKANFGYSSLQQQFCAYVSIGFDF